MKLHHSINHKWLLVAICFVAISSCKKLIQIPPNPSGQISQQAVFTDSADIISAVAGIYVNIQNIDYIGTTGLTSDELSTTDQSYLPAYSNTLTPSYPAISWSSPYTNLYIMNACIENISTTQAISTGLKNQLVGEVEVSRALYYFTLVNLYGGIPLVTGTAFQVNASLPNSPVDSVYAQIISDLTDAQKLLTPAYPSAGHARPNLYTANALLAKVYLYRQQWDSASILASSVINSGVYNLEPDLNKVFLDGSIEAIWQVPVASPYAQTVEAQNFIPYSNDIVPTYLITPYLTNAFEAGDNRKTDWLGSNTVATNGSDTVYNYPFKYKNPNNSNASTIEDYMVLRLSELYLIRAEAFSHENKWDSALADLNKVRNRAGLGNSTATGQADIPNAIMHERQVELFCEWNNRWFDLKRTGTIDTLLAKEKPGWQSYDALYPIPLTEILMDPFLTQNPGY